MKTVLEGSNDSAQAQNISGLSSINASREQHYNASLKDKMQDLLSRMSYEYHKSSILAHDNTVEDQNFEMIHKAVEKKVEEEKRQ